MNKELFDSMQKQMTPSPEVRAALSEKLAQTHKKGPVPWKKYTALAACVVLAIGGLSVYNYYQNSLKWTLFVRNFQHDAIVEPGPLHSYVTVDGAAGCFIRDSLENSEDTGTGGTETLPAQDHNTGDLSNGAYVGDAPSYEEALQAQSHLSSRVRPKPDWYGGMYIDDTGTLVVCLVESQNPGDKSLELQVLDWADSDRVAFTDVKYSLAHLDQLMDRLNHLPETDPKCRDVMASWSRDEMNNRVIVTLTEVNDHVLSVLAELDPDDDAIYVQVGRISYDFLGGETVTTDSAATEDPAVHHVMPGGVPAPDDEDLIADEPVYEGARYDLEQLPENLPQEKRPAITADSVPEEDASTSCWFPEG